MSTGRVILRNCRLKCGGSGSGSGGSTIFCLNMMVAGLDSVLRRVDQDPGHGGINLAICITTFVGRLNGSFVRNYSNNNAQDTSTV